MNDRWEQERLRKGNVLLNDALNTFYLWLYGVGHMVKDHSDSEIGNPLPPHGLLFPINSTLVTQVVEHWLEREIAQWVHPMKDRSNDPSHHERTLLTLSYNLLQERLRLRLGSGNRLTYSEIKTLPPIPHSPLLEEEFIHYHLFHLLARLLMAKTTLLEKVTYSITSPSSSWSSEITTRQLKHTKNGTG